MALQNRTVNIFNVCNLAVAKMPHLRNLALFVYTVYCFRNFTLI